MPPLRRLLLWICLLLPALVRAQETVRFRQWVGGEEIGGVEIIRESTPEGDRISQREWMSLQRLGLTVGQEVRQTLIRSKDGTIHASWTVKLAQEPMEGEAVWSPASPGSLAVSPKGMAMRQVQLPKGVLVWPGDADTRLMAAATARRSVQIQAYSIPLQQATAMDLECLGPSPLPGFPGAVKFRGHMHEGPVQGDVETWVSPTQGELKTLTTLMGMAFQLQRSELPPPEKASGLTRGFFESTLATLPPCPFALWLPELRVTWSGPQAPVLLEDSQQGNLGGGRYLLRQAHPPEGDALTQPPVSGAPSPEETPFLASTPWVRLEDPVFDGLLRRLNAPLGASRWELAGRVVDFVYTWITEKDYSVGFATAQEVARNARGDCTEHGVLAMALLRRLGVPCRAVSGWVVLERTLGPHFWVEVHIGDRWIPIDPTFDQAPASALRMKLATSDLSDLASLGWEQASADLRGATWVLQPAWPADFPIQGETLSIPQVGVLLARGHHWLSSPQGLQLSGDPALQVEAVIRPSGSQTQGARHLMGSAGRQGWWQPADGALWMEVRTGAWIRISPVGEAGALGLLDALSFEKARD
nr:transglutaminase-like domain-containing protein [uncultured Holophaga sp.]